MKDFSEYYTPNNIIKLLCKIRVGYAPRRNKLRLNNQLTTKEFYRYEKYSIYDLRILEELSKMLPVRKKWFSSGQRTYREVVDKTTGKKVKVRLNSDDKNKETLYRTVLIYQKKYPKEPFIIKLNEFIKDVIDTIEGNNGGRYEIMEPDIYPEIKEQNEGKLRYLKKKGAKLECRPISRFYLKDRIILSITNKFLTELLDPYFESSSLAFRAANKKEEGFEVMRHHKAVDRILEYKTQVNNRSLFVAECDMKKFYDTVNHQVCYEAFVKLLDKAKSNHPDINLDYPKRIFISYLESYSFYKNIIQNCNNEEYWSKQLDKNENPINGVYPWVDELLNSSTKERVGVPQGGALSGLIANIVLDAVDKKLCEIKDLFYIRYCDDMILMHPDKVVCKNAIYIYSNAIREQRLFTHEFNNILFAPNKNYKSKKDEVRVSKKRKKTQHSFENTIKPFWECKSKGPYKWGKLDLTEDSFPWIGFVGYELHYNGSIRARRRSVKKEARKQKRIIDSILNTISFKKTVNNNSIIRSAYERLNGMSIGRVEMYNYSTCINELCWADGFKRLTFNVAAKRQLKFLDMSKYTQMARLKHSLGVDINRGRNIEGNKNKEIYDYYKPFSYYYQVGEKKK